MRKLIIYILACITLFSCGKKDNPQPAKTTGFYTFQCVYNDKLSTGEIVEKPQPLIFLFIWKAENKDFELKFPDSYSGYAFDKNSQTSLKADYTINSPNNVSNELAVGRYFIYILTSSSEFPRGMYSYTYFDIKAGETTVLKKVFRDRNNFLYEIW